MSHGIETCRHANSEPDEQKVSVRLQSSPLEAGMKPESEPFQLSVSQVTFTLKTAVVGVAVLMGIFICSYSKKIFKKHVWFFICDYLIRVMIVDLSLK